MSLRQQAKIIGVSAPYLSQMINGKRPWNPDIKARYEALAANTFANTQQKSDNESADLLWRIRLAAEDTALSRRRSRVRIPYALPENRDIDRQNSS